MTEKRADGGDDVGQNGSRHVGQITFLKNQSEQIIKADINQVSKNGVPDTDKEEAYFYLMFQP